MKKKVIGGTLTFIMILVCCLNVLSINVGALSYGRASIAHYTSVYGDNVSTSSNGYNATVIVYGNIYCYNTISLIKGICESEWGNSNDVKLIYADAKNNSVKAVKDFADEHRGKFNYCYDTSNAISADMWHYAHMIGINERLTFPVVVIKDSNENIKYISTNYLNEVVIYDAICDFTIISYKAPNSYTEIEINGKQHYSYAYDVLNKVNEQRAEHGLPSLVMDKDLLDAAMLRASEIAILFSHNRPNGKQWHSALNSIGTYAENIARGQDTPTIVMDNWMNSSGHRNNILNSKYTSIGIGCFEYEDSSGTNLCWVQLFSNVRLSECNKSANIKSVVAHVTVKPSNITLSLRISKDKSITAYANTCKISLSNISFSSNNPDIATIRTTGEIYSTKSGTTVITATLKNNHDINTTIEFTSDVIDKVKVYKRMYTESCTAKLYWNKDKSVSGYRIQQYKNGKWVTVKTVTNITSVKVINLQPNHIYKYKICAYKTINGKKIYGEYSDLISIKITQT